MKNPISLLAKCMVARRALQFSPPIFSIGDASLYLRSFIQPQRITEWEFMRFVRRELSIKEMSGGVREVTIKRNGLVFYWLGKVCGGLGASVLQEYDETFPHCYTTAPIHLEPSSIVFDVGACEGLFAFRVLKDRLAKKVVCFEPSERTASFLRQGAEANGVLGQLEIEICAVGKTASEVYFSDSIIPEGNKIISSQQNGARKIRQVSLDQYACDKNFHFQHRDLIKIDAEGTDVDVVRGAEKIIREQSPQIAVTTYHDPEHALQLVELLRKFQPRYQLRLKGFTVWGDSDLPRPVLLQASMLSH